MPQTLKAALLLTLANSKFPVERDIAHLLGNEAKPNDAESFRLQRYRRKIDVAHRVAIAYDGQIDQAVSDQALSSEGYQGLALVFLQCAQQETGTNDCSRARALKWLNSAFNCLDQARLSDGTAALDLKAELQAELCRVSLG